jgi:hypothetical protein
MVLLISLRSDPETSEPVLPNRFIVLEDLCAPFKRPCVLDLKMGTRVHGDFASPEKIESQRKKCQDTTSTRYVLMESDCMYAGLFWENFFL